MEADVCAGDPAVETKKTWVFAPGEAFPKRLRAELVLKVSPGDVMAFRTEERPTDLPDPPAADGFDTGCLLLVGTDGRFAGATIRGGRVVDQIRLNPSAVLGPAALRSAAMQYRMGRAAVSPAEPGPMPPL